MAYLVYIHGFNSSANSKKAQLLKTWFERDGATEKFLSPTLSHQPSAAIRTLENIVVKIGKRGGQFTLVGSLLGGYYATWLAEKYAARAVLINPAVRPYDLLASRLGPQMNLYSNEHYILTPRHLAALKRFEVMEVTHPQRYLVLLQTGDEVLDYRQALEKYRDTKPRVIPGGDHGFQDFDSAIPEILAFSGISLGSH